MKKKIVSLLIAVMMLIVSIPKYNFAAERGKVIFINMNRTTIEAMQDIPSLNEQLNNRGYIGLMNIIYINNFANMEIYILINDVSLE